MSATIFARHTCGEIVAALIVSERTIRDIAGFIAEMENDGLSVGVADSPVQFGDCKCFEGTDTPQSGSANA